MFGVASLLCRLGLHFRFTTPQSPLAVSKLMATLDFLHPKRDGQLAVYSSDPVLALGATRVWYSRTTALSEFILPEFKRLLVQDMLDVHSSNELAACILLLLAVDTCEVVESEAVKHGDCAFMGHFVSVELFMQALGGMHAPLMSSKQTLTPGKGLKANFDQWRSQWSTWKLGFTHYIHLRFEPTEDTLWYLLGRRAAGVFPRDHDGVDLIIPMFCGSKVSMILIQIEDARPRERESFEEDLLLMHPSSVFGEGNPLKTKSPCETIRVAMSFGKEQTVLSSDPDRFYKCGPSDLSSIEFESTEAASHLLDGSFVLCVCFVGHAWNIEIGGITYPVVLEGAATKLADLVSSRWDPIGLVASDLCHRREVELKYARVASVARLSEVMADEELLHSASQALLNQPGCRDDEELPTAGNKLTNYPQGSEEC